MPILATFAFSEEERLLKKSLVFLSTKVTILRRHLSNNTVINRNGSAKVPASSFSVSSRRFWDKIKNNEKLDILSHQVLEMMYIHWKL